MEMFFELFFFLVVFVIFIIFDFKRGSNKLIKLWVVLMRVFLGLMLLLVYIFRNSIFCVIFLILKE